MSIRFPILSSHHLAIGFKLGAIAGLLSACGASVEDADASGSAGTAGATAQPAETAQTAQAISLCGRTPPPIPCFRAVCLGGDASWEYEPLPAGATCSGGGHCDGDGNCITQPPPPPADHTVTVAINDSVRSIIQLLLSGSVVSIDTSGNAPVLVTGSHQECTDPPGPNPLYCWTVSESTNAYVKFSDTLKALYQARTNRALSDLAFPQMGAVCGGPTFLETCGYVNQIHADLGNIGVALGGSGSSPSVSVTLPVDSAHPTLLLGAPYPNVDFSNMQVTFNVALGAANSKLVVTGVTGSLAYHRNLVNFPDWLVDGFYDIDGKINSALDQRISKIFSDDSRREAIAAALTRALELVAQQQNPGFTGFKEILAVRVNNGALSIDYTPNP